MTEAELQAKVAFLLMPASLELLRAICADPRDELALAGSPAMRGLPAPHRIALLEQRKLRLKAARKRPEALGMIFTSLGLEQITHAELAAYKATRLSAGADSIADLCCGLGGDSMYLPERIRVCGVDQSRGTLMAYRHNLGTMRPARPAAAVEADVEAAPVKADAAILDPARRARGKSDRWQDQDMSPGWDVIERLIARYGSMAIKLGPGIAFPDFMNSYEWEYLGLRDECLECVVWTGSLGRPGLMRATELPGGNSVEARREDIPDSFPEPGAPAGFLYEPVKAVVRAHLFGVLAEKHRLRQIDPRIAWLTGDTLVRDPLLKAFQVECELPFETKAIREFLRKHEVGRLEIKKRGVNLVPEEFRASVKLAGPNEGTLIFTKAMDKKTVFWAKRVAGGPPEGPEEAQEGES